MIKLVLNFAFVDLKLSKVIAHVFEGNKASRNVLEKNGFKIEGKFKKSVLAFNQWHSEIVFAVSAEEYK